MRYTKEQLEAMSDNKINLLISAIKYKAWCISNKRWNNVAMRNYESIKIKMNPHEYTDYCNNPSDMMPLVFECNISLVDPESFGCSEWQAGKFYTDFKSDIQAKHKNPLRACAIVYILINQ